MVPLLVVEILAFAVLVVLFMLCATDDTKETLPAMPWLIVAILVCGVGIGCTFEAILP